MSSRREQILARIATVLAGTVGVSTRIYRSRQEAFARNEAPAIVIEPGPDRGQAMSTCKIDWTLDVIIAVYARGAIPDQLADPTIVSMHNKIMADRTLNGLAIDVMPTLVDPQFDKADQTALWMVCTYQVRYRTAQDALDS